MNNIGWCDTTHNLITGCLNHTDGLCKGGGFPCYAYKLAHGRLKLRYRYDGGQILLNTKAENKDDRLHNEINPFYPRIWPDRFKKKFPKGTRRFLNDMSDWLGIGIPDEWTQKCIDYMKSQPDVIFQTLTKQPQRLSKWSPFPENAWVGVTITTAAMDRNALPYIAQLENNIVFASMEPMLEFIPCGSLLKMINWLIIGACTGTKQEMLDLQKKYPDLTVVPFENRYTAQPKIEWVREIVEAADKAGIPVYLKDNLEPLLDPNSMRWAFKYSYSGDPSENFVDCELRQEFPQDRKV